MSQPNTLINVHRFGTIAIECQKREGFTEKELPERRLPLAVSVAGLYWNGSRLL